MTSSLRSLLVVDDHPLALSGTTTFLAHALPEVQVHAAIGRRQALALVEEGVRPDVVLLDVWLSDCTGFDAMRELRGKLPEARFAFMSAENTPEIVAKAQALGAIGF
ncbi:response regulator, partial [Corynebacterium sp. 35RC1]|nr:response regulator [Corynebacterium sp. 35RC1]